MNTDVDFSKNCNRITKKENFKDIFHHRKHNFISIYLINIYVHVAIYTEATRSDLFILNKNIEINL